MAALLERIASSPRVTERVALVVAHPDDETLGLGSRLAALRALKIIHLTDGAPRSLDDARRAGFADAAGYAAARRRELDAALAALGASAAERVAYAFTDQESIDHLDAIVERLVADLAGRRAVITHSYEHGHPDHDTAALAVALACRRLEREGESAPLRFEFASYHLREGQTALGVFWPDPARPELRIELDEAASRAKRAAIECHATQRELVTRFAVSPERLRAAPDYDFAAPAPPGACLYDGFGWTITSERWRAAAARAWRAIAGDERAATWRAAVTDAR